MIRDTLSVRLQIYLLNDHKYAFFTYQCKSYELFQICILVCSNYFFWKTTNMHYGWARVSILRCNIYVFRMTSSSFCRRLQICFLSEYNMSSEWPQVSLFYNHNYIFWTASSKHTGWHNVFRLDDYKQNFLTDPSISIEK